MHWQTTRYRIDLTRPRVMGIVNVTPDSFSDGGRYLAPSDAIARAESLVRDGADILDLGAESTRPGAVAPDTAEELSRLMPVLKAVLDLGVPVSVDTSNPEVMHAVLDAGADIVNDVRSLARPGALDMVARHPSAGLCLMHLRGEPATMQAVVPDYPDVVAEVRDFLRSRLDAALSAGIAPGRIVLDPGIGFAKTPAHNLSLLRRQRDLEVLGRPLLVGWSRKSTLGLLTGRPAAQRVAASVAAAVLAVHEGARIVRVHDVAETVDAVKLWTSAFGPHAGPG
ncbi:MAG: dihydropteroate synthase [Burkholderiaceae bacterium]|nr:dihydropteroate synthase [Burkholderiaceae bacterium]